MVDFQHRFSEIFVSPALDFSWYCLKSSNHTYALSDSSSVFSPFIRMYLSQVPTLSVLNPTVFITIFMDTATPYNSFVIYMLTITITTLYICGLKLKEG